MKLLIKIISYHLFWGFINISSPISSKTVKCLPVPLPVFVFSAFQCDALGGFGC